MPFLSKHLNTKLLWIFFEAPWSFSRRNFSQFGDSVLWCNICSRGEGARIARRVNWIKQFRGYSLTAFNLEQKMTDIFTRQGAGEIK